MTFLSKRKIVVFLTSYIMFYIINISLNFNANTIHNGFQYNDSISYINEEKVNNTIDAYRNKDSTTNTQLVGPFRLKSVESKQDKTRQDTFYLFGIMGGKTVHNKHVIEYEKDGAKIIEIFLTTIDGKSSLFPSFCWNVRCKFSKSNDNIDIEYRKDVGIVSSGFLSKLKSNLFIKQHENDAKIIWDGILNAFNN